MAEAALTNRRRWTTSAIAVAIAALLVVDASGASRTFRIDPAQSSATIHVGKSGVLSFVAGHTHEIVGPVGSGEVQVDPETPATARIRLVIAASALRVSAAGEPAGDVPKVQEAMESPKVLDVARYPEIRFESTSVAMKSRTGGVLDLAVTGQLTIRDATRPVTADVHAELGENRLKATGRFTVKQSTFGITPISVGGVVTVKDDIQIDFTIVAQG